MTEALDTESNRALASAIGRRVACTLTAVLAGTGMAGFLPGDSIVLGLLSSDVALDIARALGALLLGYAVLSRSDRWVRYALTTCGVFAVAVGCWTALEPHAGGVLPRGTTFAESILTVAFGSIGLSTAKIMSGSGAREAASPADRG